MSEPLEYALARLFTDAALRQKLGRDPHALGQKLGLSAADSARLAALDAGDVAAQADVLAHVQRRRGR
jgi:hypothetical protein